MQTAIYTGNFHKYLKDCRVAIGKDILGENNQPTGFVNIYPVLPCGRVSFVASDARMTELNYDGGVVKPVADIVTV